MNLRRTNTLLLLLVLTLGTLVWWSTREQPAAPPQLLTELQPEQINSIVLSNRSGAAIRLRLSAGRWQMTEPYVVEANEVLIQRLMQITTSPVRHQFPIEPSRLDEFGLAPAKARLRLNQLDLVIGETDPINHDRYLAIGAQLYLIKDLFPHLLLAPATSYVSPNVLPSGSELELIRTSEWQLERTLERARAWQLTPESADISMDQLIEQVDEWKSAQAVGVTVAPDTAPEDWIEIRLRDSRTPLSFGILRQRDTNLLIREDLHLAYQLPQLLDLLALPRKRSQDH